MAQKFSASRFFPHVREHRVTVAAGNPTTINILLNGDGDAHRDNLPSLRFLTSSSAPLTVEEWRRFEAALRHSDRARLRIERDRLDRRDPRRERGGTARSGGRSPITTSRLSTANGRLAAGAIGQVEIGGFADHDYRYLAEDGRVTVELPRPHAAPATSA